MKQRRKAVRDSANQAINGALAAGVVAVLVVGAVTVVDWATETDPLSQSIEFLEPVTSRMGRHDPARADQ